AVLPDEDPEEYQGRLESWTATLKPRNDDERRLVGRMVQASWQLERADRVETARLASAIRTAAGDPARREEDEAAARGVGAGPPPGRRQPGAGRLAVRDQPADTPRLRPGPLPAFRRLQPG